VNDNIQVGGSADIYLQALAVVTIWRFEAGLKACCFGFLPSEKPRDNGKTIGKPLGKMEVIGGLPWFSLW